MLWRYRVAMWSLIGFGVLGGCSTTAVVTERSGGTIEGEILGSDRRNVYVQGSADRVAISRDDIVDIDYPGNVAATIGAILTVYGAVNIAVGAPQCSAKGGAFCTGVFTPAAIGIPLTIWGIAVYSGARAAVNKGVGAEHATRIFLGPTYQVAGETKAPGLVFGGTF